MGNSAPTTDERVQRCAEILKMTKADIAGFYRLFRSFDLESKGYISIDSFFKMIGEGKSILGQALFELIDIDEADRLEFGEFVQSVCTYCLFETREILQLCFFIYDRDKNGYMAQDELQFFISALHDGEIAGNTQLALMKVTFNRDGKFDFNEMVNLNSQYPAILFPAFRLQASMMNSILGERWWLGKKNMLAFLKEEELMRDFRRRKKKLKESEKKRLRRKRQDIGSYAWWFKPQVRDDWDARHPPKTIEDIKREEEVEQERAAAEADAKILAAAKSSKSLGSQSPPMSPTA